MWGVSKWVTDPVKLKDLGFNVLMVKDDKIQAALHNHNNSIHDAAHDILSEWRDQYYTREEAYNSLYRGLRRCGMNHWAAQLRQLARE